MSNLLQDEYNKAKIALALDFDMSISKNAIQQLNRIKRILKNHYGINADEKFYGPEFTQEREAAISQLYQKYNELREKTLNSSSRLERSEDSKIVNHRENIIDNPSRVDKTEAIRIIYYIYSLNRSLLALHIISQIMELKDLPNLPSR